MSNTLNNPYYSDLTGQLQCTFIRSVDNGTSGDCTLITGEVTGLIDLGADPTLERVRGKIWEKGTRTLVGSDEKVKLDFVVLTHYHADHVTSDIASAINSLSTDSRIDLSSCVFYLPHNRLDLTYTGSGETWEAENYGFRIYTDENTGIKYPRIKQIRDRQTACENKLTEYYGSSATTHIIKPVASNDDPLNTTWEETAVEKVFNDHLKLSFLNVNPDNYLDYYPYTGSNQNWADHGTDYNAFSMLTILEHYNHKFVFTGDMVMPAQEKYVDWITDCDVYKVEHHGLEYNTSDKWLNALNPRYAVICKYSDTIEYNPDGSYYGEVSFNRDDEYTYRKTVQHLAAKGTKIFSTYDSESVVIESTIDALKVLEGNTYTHLYGNLGFNVTYPYFRASRNQLQENSDFSIVGGGFTRYGNMIVVQMMVRAKVTKAANHYWTIAGGFPRPFYVGVPIAYPFPEKGLTTNEAHSWHAPMQIIRYGNKTEHYTGWIYPADGGEKGVLRVGVGATNIPANSTLYISGVYFARKGE